jgi:hypothetical protein
VAVLKYYNTTTSAWEYIAASTTANFTSWKKTMAGGETSVSGTDDNAVTLSYTVGLEQVFINGVLQVRGSDYTATTGTSVTGLTALIAGDIVTVVCYAPFNIANTIAPTLVDAKGDLLVGTGADAVGRLAVGVDTAYLRPDSTASTGLKWDNDAWASWTPVISGTGWSVGNGTLTATYKQIGKTVFFRIRFVLGSTTGKGAGGLGWSLPVNTTSNQIYASFANANYLDSGNEVVMGYVHSEGTNNINLYAINASGTYAKQTSITSTVPFTWATNDEIFINGTYEAA